MKTREIEEIIDLLPKGRTKYFYYKDKYAVDLLSYAFEEASIADIKRSRFSGLLRKPIVSDCISSIGTKTLRSKDLEDVWPDDIEPYLLTLGKWGYDRHGERDYYQTTTSDANLVLQLNFSNRHNAAFRRYVGEEYRSPYAYYGHPIAPVPNHTLAWARIDLSLDSGEALIEEIQTDWIRRGNQELIYYRNRLEDLSLSERRRLTYLECVLSPHVKMWREAILAAAIWFLYREIGLSKIYYHSYESGCRLKRIDQRRPPRSLYEELPRRFCFETWNGVPRFLEDDLRKNRLNPRFYFSDFGKKIGG